MWKIVDIFADQLFSFAYPLESGEGFDENEYDRLMALWTNVSYLRQYAKDNGVHDINQFTLDRLKDAEEIQDILESITTEGKALSSYFQPLSQGEAFKELSKRKGKKGRNGLRLYAVKIEDDCFVITGGAIKMCQKMQDHPDTNKELAKIKRAVDYLKEEGAIDKAAFFELKSET